MTATTSGPAGQNSRANSARHNAGHRPGAPRHPNDMKEKFELPAYDLLPPPVPSWSRALAAVDRTQPAPGSDTAWRFWVPDPASLVRAGSSARVDMNVMHWLGARDHWLALLQQHFVYGQPMKPLRGTDWADLLTVGIFDELRQEGKPTHTHARRAATIKEFRAQLPRTAGQPIVRNTKWNHALITETLTARQAKEITWELAELGFRSELWELDLTLVPNADRKSERNPLFAGVFEDYMVRDRWPPLRLGLASPVLSERVKPLDALRRLLSRWPSAPDAIRNAMPLESTTPDSVVLELEDALCRYYTQTLWETAGRAATILRVFPADG